MRNLIPICILALAQLAACGPSGRDVALAKTARYTGDKLVLFNAIKDTAASKYKLAMSDETTLSLQTTGRWYTPEGLVATGSGAADIRQLPDKSINVVLTVKMLPDGNQWVVDVDANMMRYNAGMPNPEQLSLKDPSLPGWASGKVDQLAFDIYDALKRYEVKAPGAQMPPPATESAPAGNDMSAPAGSDTAPAAGGDAAPAPASEPAPAPTPAS